MDGVILGAARLLHDRLFRGLAPGAPRLRRVRDLRRAVCLQVHEPMPAADEESELIPVQVPVALKLAGYKRTSRKARGLIREETTIVF